MDSLFSLLNFDTDEFYLDSLDENIDKMYCFYTLELCQCKIFGKDQTESKEGLKRVKKLLEEVNKYKI